MCLGVLKQCTVYAVIFIEESKKNYSLTLIASRKNQHIFLTSYTLPSKFGTKKSFASLSFRPCFLVA